MEGVASAALPRAVLALSIIGYVVLMFGISLRAQHRIRAVDDYVVAGRSLPLLLATATLLATWFGAGTLLTATDEVRARGLTGATLDPIGAGCCLLLVGLFFAGPLWRMQLRTLPDFFRIRFGRRAEWTAALLMIPPYLGWIAAQFIALAGMLDLFFGIPLPWGISLIACVGTGYTLLGGMWAVTLTDAVQVALLIVGVVVLALVVLVTLGAGDPQAGWQRLLAQPAERWQLIPTASLAEFAGWVGVLCAGALGNIPSQDVMQRVFSARSARVARAACVSAGVLYLVIGLAPVLIGLAAPLLLPDARTTASLPLLAQLFAHPALALILVLSIMSAVLSTIDSAILAPATVLAEKLWPQARWFPGADALARNRFAVLLIGALSLGVAALGQGAYELLASGYELGMVSLLAPLTIGLFSKGRSRPGILASMWLGTLVWVLHQALGLQAFLGLGMPVPADLACMGLSFAIYWLVASAHRPARPG